MSRPHPPRTPIERDIVEAEASLNEFAERNPDVAVTILRSPTCQSQRAHCTSTCSRCRQCR